MFALWIRTCVQGSHFAQYSDRNDCDKLNGWKQRCWLNILQCALFLDAAHIRRKLVSLESNNCCLLILEHPHPPLDLCLLHLWRVRTAGYPQIIRRRHTFVSICNTIPQACCICDNRAAPWLAPLATPLKSYWPRPENTSVWWRPQPFKYRTTRHC